MTAPSARAGTVQTLTSGTALDVAGDFTPAGVPTVGSDVLIAAGYPTAATAVTVNSANTSSGITFGSLNDTNTFNLTLRNATLNSASGSAAFTVTLGGGNSTDAVTGSNAADLLYVASGSTFNTSSSTSSTSTTGGILSLALGQSGNFDIVGTSTLASTNISTGAFTLTKTGAGTLTSSGSLTLGSGGGLVVNAGTMTQSAVVGGAGTVTVNGGLLALAGTNTYTGGTTINSGGTVTTTSSRSLGTGTLNMSGGTFQYSNATLTAPSTAFTNVLSLPGGTSVFSVVNTSTTVGGRVNLSVNNPITGAGGITVGGSTLGGLTTTGTSSVQFASTNTYTGATNVPLGQTVVLNIAGSSANSALNLSGGSLYLTTGRTAASTFASVAVNPGANYIDVLAANNASAGTIATTSSLGPITRTAGGTVDFLLPTSGTLTTPTANTANAILGAYATANGGASWVTSAGTGTVDGAITALAAFGNDYTAAGPTTDFDATGSGTFASSAVNSIRFNTPAPVTVSSTPGLLTLASGGILVTPSVGANASAIADGTLSSSNGADLIVQQYNNVSGGALTITAGITDGTGATALTKAGPGLLVLGGANTFTGPTYINGGTLQVGQNDATGSIAFSQPTQDNGALVINRSDNNTISGVISGTGSVAYNGSGTTTLTATNTYAGATAINAGTVVTPVLALNSLPGQITVSNNANLQFSAGGSSSSGRTFVLGTGGATFSSTASNTAFLNGVISGSTLLTKTGTGTIFLGNSGNSFTGGIDIQSGSLSVGTNGVFGTLTAGTVALTTIESTGTLLFDAGNFLGSANTVLSANRAFALNGTGPQMNVTTTWTWTIPGNVSNGSTVGSLTKVGGGTLSLTGGSNSYSGGTNVNAGTLRANNLAAGGLATGPGTVTVNGGLLGGNGSVGAVIVNSGGTIGAGSSTTNISTLTTGAETWNSGGAFLSKYNASTPATGTFDRLVMSSLTVASTSTAPFTVNLANTSTGVTVASTTIIVLANDTEAAATNPFSPANSAATLAALTLNTSSGVAAASGFNLQLDVQADATNGYDLILDTVAAPEPASLVLLGLTAAPLALGRRRRSRHPAVAQTA